MPERRVRRPRQKDELLAQLVNDGPFQTYRDTLGFAAALGFAGGKRVPFQQSSEPIRWEDFASRASNDCLVKLIAVEDSGTFDALSTDTFEDRLTTFEEYANGGLEILEEHLSMSTRPPLDSILDLMLEFESPEVPNEPLNLEDIAKKLAW